MDFWPWVYEYEGYKIPRNMVVSSQDVVETGYAPSILMHSTTFTTAYHVYIGDSPSILSTNV